jgi:NitT/TauT family transport system permease protein
MANTAKRLAFFAFLIGIWALVAARHVWNPTLFPGPDRVAKTLWEQFHSGALINATAISLRRVLLGYGISLAIGVPLGILLARQKLLDITVGSLVSGFQSLPSICWLPLALLWFGLNDRAILFVVVAGSLVSITVSVQDGVKNLSPTYVRAAQTMGTPSWRIYTEVLMPASLPAILTGAKLGWGYAWRALMSGELLFVSLGLGQMLMQGRELADMSQVISVMIVIMALGLVTDKVIFGSLERHVRRRWGLDVS